MHVYSTGGRAAEHLLEALLGALCSPCPPGLGTGLPIPAEPQALSCCWLTFLLLHNRNVEQVGKQKGGTSCWSLVLLWHSGESVAPGAVTCEMKVRPRKAQRHWFPCRAAPSCPLGPGEDGWPQPRLQPAQQPPDHHGGGCPMGQPLPTNPAVSPEAP